MAKTPVGRFANADDLAAYLRSLRSAPPEATLERTFTGRKQRAVTAFSIPTHRTQRDLQGQPTDMHAVVPLMSPRATTPRRQRSTAVPVMALVATLSLALWSQNVTDPAPATAMSPAAVVPPMGGAHATTTPETGPRPAADRRLRELLARAEEALDELRLTRPQGNNAVHYFREALAVDESNAASLEGLRRVAARYTSLATTALERSEFEKARVLIGRGRRVAPDDVDLRTLEAKLRRFETMTLAEAPREPFPDPGSRAPGVEPPAEIEGETPQELLNRIRGWFR